MTKTTDSLSPEFLGLLEIGFRYSSMQSAYKAMADKIRESLQDYLLKHKETLKPGSGITVAGGGVQRKIRSTYKIDTAKLAQLVVSGYLSIEALINLAFPGGKLSYAEPMRVILGTNLFEEITSIEKIEYITLCPDQVAKEAAKQQVDRIEAGEVAPSCPVESRIYSDDLGNSWVAIWSTEDDRQAASVYTFLADSSPGPEALSKILSQIKKPAPIIAIGRVEDPVAWASHLTKLLEENPQWQPETDLEKVDFLTPAERLPSKTNPGSE